MAQVEYYKCRCHRYDFATGLRVSKSIDHELDYCNKFIAVSPKSWGKIAKVLNKMRSSKHK